MNTQPPDNYQTKDLGEAAALLCHSAKLLKLHPNENFSWFIFSDNQLCRKLSHQYWFGELLVNAKSYQEALRALKDRLFAQHQ